MRSGLAPLELVLWIPVLLVVAALMVNFSAMAVWRVRGEVVARDAIWRARWPRNGQNEPRPDYWPEEADVGIRQDNIYDRLDLPAVDHPVVRGPIPNGFVVLPTLDPTRGAARGTSAIERRQPALSSLPEYESGEIGHPVLTAEWSAAEMGIPNVFRRSKAIYILPRVDHAIVQRFVSSIEDLLAIPHWNALDVLDRDHDLFVIARRYFDFYPRLRHPYSTARLVDLTYSELDPQVVSDKWIITQPPRRPGLVDSFDVANDVRFGHISMLPRQLTATFLNYYRRVLREIQRLEDELGRLGPDDDLRRQAILARLAELRRLNAEEKIRQLEAYQDSLPERYDRMRDAVRQAWMMR